MKEIWKDIQNYNGYQVSNLGRVRTYNKISYTKKHGYRHWKNRILKQKKTNKNGRIDYRVDLWKDNKPKTIIVSRLVAFTFDNKNINDRNLTVNHIDGNSKNNRIDNLELISLKNNIIHGFDNNLYSSQKHTLLINKKTNKKYEFRSMSLASQFMGKNKGYISAKTIKNIYGNNDYIWEVY